MANALQIDTLAFSKRLRDAGADEQLANAIVEGLTAADTSDLATKADVKALDEKMATKADVAEVRTEIAEVKSDLKALDEKMATKAEVAEVKAEILKWMFGALFAQTGIILAVVKLL